MPNPQHVARLRAGFEAWNAWRSAPATRGETPDLQGANLVGASLRRTNLALANLKGADLTEAELSGADLGGTDLRKAKLTGAILKDAVLRAANASEAILSGTDLRRSDLGGANLILTDLSGANLAGAQLRAANLSGADLEGCLLSGANLGDAVLFGSNLAGAELDGCNLDGADLGEAILKGGLLVHTSLVRTDLAGADFRGARAAGCSFGANDLSRCRGLDEVVHLGPSSVATTTLMRTAEGVGSDEKRRTEIDAFLRGCGLEDHWLRQFKDLVGRAEELAACFISHADADRAFARMLHDALQARGIRCWLGERRADAQQTSGRGPRPAFIKLVLCCSAASLSGSWIEREIDEVLEEGHRLLKLGRKPPALIPIVLDDALATWRNPRAAAMRERIGADFGGWERQPSLGEALDRLVHRLNSAADQRGGQVLRAYR